MEVHRLWHRSWELDPLESLEVQLPNISQNHLSVVASANEHIIFYLDTAVASSGCWEADFLVRFCGDLLPGVGFQVVSGLESGLGLEFLLKLCIFVCVYIF